MPPKYTGITLSELSGRKQQPSKGGAKGKAGRAGKGKGKPGQQQARPQAKPGQQKPKLQQKKGNGKPQPQRGGKPSNPIAAALAPNASQADIQKALIVQNAEIAKSLATVARQLSTGAQVPAAAQAPLAMLAKQSGAGSKAGRRNKPRPQGGQQGQRMVPVMVPFSAAPAYFR